LGQALRGLDRETVGEVGLAVLLGRLERVDVRRRLGPSRHDLQRDHVGTVAGLTQVVGDAQPVVAILARELEPAELVAGPIQHHRVVAVRGRPEEPVRCPRHDPALRARRGRKSSASSRSHSSPRTPLPPQESLYSDRSSMSAKTAAGSIPSTSRAPRNGGSGTVTSRRSDSRPALAGAGSGAGVAFGVSRSATASARRSAITPPRSSPSLSRSITPRPSNASLQ